MRNAVAQSMTNAIGREKASQAVSIERERMSELAAQRTSFDGTKNTDPNEIGANVIPGVGAVHHAIALLKALPSDGRPIGVSELARQIGLHKSTVSRLVATLSQHDFIERQDGDGGVRLGMGIVALLSPLFGKLDVSRFAKPILDMIAAETGETANLALWRGTEAVMADQTLGSRAVVHYAWPGKCVPAHTTAAGKAFLAHLPCDALEKLLAGGLRRYTKFSIINPVELRRELETVRQRGFAVNDEENELESCGVASVVRDFRGEVCAVLTVAGPKHRFEPRQREAIAAVVVRAAEELSRRLGHADGASTMARR